jgi:hypothetical protein
MWRKAIAIMDLRYFCLRFRRPEPISSAIQDRPDLWITPLASPQGPAGPREADDMPRHAGVALLHRELPRRFPPVREPFGAIFGDLGCWGGVGYGVGGLRGF